jgi:hypothetical protein
MDGARTTNTAISDDDEHEQFTAISDDDALDVLRSTNNTTRANERTNGEQRSEHDER